MTEQGKFKIGDIVEVVYDKKVLGYLFKELDDRILLASTTEIEDSTPFKVIMKKDINSIASFGNEDEKKQQEKSNVPDEMGKVIEFPANSKPEGEIS